MSEEKREILEHLVEYLQDKIDTGYHKIFYNDDMYDEKTIDCINAINDTLEENKRLNKENEELKKIQCTFLGTGCKAEIERLHSIINESAEEILKELEENHHLSYGVALAIRQKLLNYKELKGSDKE